VLERTGGPRSCGTNLLAPWERSDFEVRLNRGIREFRLGPNSDLEHSSADGRRRQKKRAADGGGDQRPEAR
jgi:hypothetical protein